MNFAGSDLFEIAGEIDGRSIRAIYSKEDDEGERLIVIAGNGSASILPKVLSHARDAAYSRMLSFFQRAHRYPVVLPRGWRQFKHDNLVAFFALPESFGSTQRWIAEVNADGLGDVVFWTLAESAELELLQKYVPERRLHSLAREHWAAHRVEGRSAMAGPVEKSVGFDVTLGTTDAQLRSLAKDRTYTEWLPALTPSQRAFVEAPTDGAIRLRGPAGSGKTLTLCLKAVREVSNARADGRTCRVLFLTHSWSLASDVDELLRLLSEQGPLDEIDVLPLVSVAQETLPAGMIPADLSLIGDDSMTGKMVQLAQIEELIEEFRGGDWVTFRNEASAEFTERVESQDRKVTRGLAWDCLVEFGCVLAADGIFPSVNAERRYLRVPRAPWMMQLGNVGDKRSVYAMYEMYYKSLQERNLITSDQLLNDFLNYLEGFTWNHRRKLEGYDLVFVDEYHLFNTLERQTIRYLSREVASYPRMFMAMDSRQSPWEVYFTGIAAESTAAASVGDEDLGLIETVDIRTVHRSSPQILDLIKHIHLEYANLSLDEDWDFSISEVESMATPGPKPVLLVADTFGDEETAIFKAVSETYPNQQKSLQVALALIDEDAYRRYIPLIQNLAKSGRFKVTELASRDDAGSLNSKRGLVVGPAEYLAGLQFDTVLVAGLPEISEKGPNQGVRRRGALSLLYLAVSRASRDVRLFVNEDFSGIPEVLSRARDHGVLGIFRV